LRADGLNDAGAVFGRPDLAAIARGFGAQGHQVADLADLPALIDGISGVTLLDFPISDRVASPVMARAHPHKGY
ncbi:MAG: thiamine pyrophosphate-binding protein, partial [Planktomarina temperata]|nr:thiamine pyrophosphate-binding protein [Planktomarina temperata]